jgi:hypothetical protein
LTGLRRLTAGLRVASIAFCWLYLDGTTQKTCQGNAQERNRSQPGASLEHQLTPGRFGESTVRRWVALAAVVLTDLLPPAPNRLGLSSPGRFGGCVEDAAGAAVDAAGGVVAAGAVVAAVVVACVAAGLAQAAGGGVAVCGLVVGVVVVAAAEGIRAADAAGLALLATATACGVEVALPWVVALPLARVAVEGCGGVPNWPCPTCGVSEFGLGTASTSRFGSGAAVANGGGAASCFELLQASNMTQQATVCATDLAVGTSNMAENLPHRAVFTYPISE